MGTGGVRLLASTRPSLLISLKGTLKNPTLPFENSWRHRPRDVVYYL